MLCLSSPTLTQSKTKHHHCHHYQSKKQHLALISGHRRKRNIGNGLRSLHHQPNLAILFSLILCFFCFLYSFLFVFSSPPPTAPGNIFFRPWAFWYYHVVQIKLFVFPQEYSVSEFSRIFENACFPDLLDFVRLKVISDFSKKEITSVLSVWKLFLIFSEKEITSVLSSPQACHTRSTWKNFGWEYFLSLVCYWPQKLWVSGKRISLKSDLSWSRKRTFDFPPLFHEAKIGWIPVLWEKDVKQGMKLFLFIFSFLISKAADFFVGSIFTSFSSSWPTAFPSCEKSTDTTWEIHKWGRATLFVETWGLQNNSFFRNIHLRAAGVPINPAHPFLLTCTSGGDKRPNT